MHFEIIDGTLSAGGNELLTHFHFDIKGNEKIAIVGANGTGKTTLLKAIAGELLFDSDDKRQGPAIKTDRKLIIRMLSQTAYTENNDGKNLSAGQRTRAELVKLFGEEPDILVLDEPTNNLDFESVLWLEQKIKSWPRAVIMVSHDRYFLDECADIVYEISGKKLKRYAGNYTFYRKAKVKERQQQEKIYEKKKAEADRLNADIARFKHKSSKSSFARAKKKQIERLGIIERPEPDDIHIFTGEIVPENIGGKKVWEAEHLKCGYEAPLFEISVQIKRGQKLGLIGRNGVGKTTLIRAIAEKLSPLAGKSSLGQNIEIGYFDQNTAAITSEQTVLEHFSNAFPIYNEKEARNQLAAYLFKGVDAAKKVSDLSGGEKARLVLCEMLTAKPNFLILDEPTNHMDIAAKETLESAFRAYKGTIVFISHDRYFINQVAEQILNIRDGQVFYYPFGYSHYVDKVERKLFGAGSAEVLAEDEALIEKLKAVPKREHHEHHVTLEEAQFEWEEGLLMETLLPAEEAYLEALRAYETAWEEWYYSEEYWIGDEAASEGRAIRELAKKRDAAWLAWHEECLKYVDKMIDLLYT